MTNQQMAEQQRLSEILKLARMQLNDEYMKNHRAAHTAWITGARTAWTTSGTLIPFTTKFVYPTEEEVVARGVEIYNTLTQRIVTPAPAPTPAPTVSVLTTEPMDIVEVDTAIDSVVTVELLQAGGDFVIANATQELLSDETHSNITDAVIKEETFTLTEPTVEPTVTDSLLENKFKSLFTKWGGKGNY